MITVLPTLLGRVTAIKEKKCGTQTGAYKTLITPSLMENFLFDVEIPKGITVDDDLKLNFDVVENCATLDGKCCVSVATQPLPSKENPISTAKMADLTILLNSLPLCEKYVPMSMMLPYDASLQDHLSDAAAETGKWPCKI